MKYLDNFEIGEKKLYSDRYFSDKYDHLLYLKKSVDDGSNKIKMYISASTIINGIEIQQGYLYFYLDNNQKTSDFIGLKVNPEFRNLNIGSLLISTWIDICLNSGYDFLKTHEKQRKPFLIYLLKKYGFEVNDKMLYETRDDIITIGKSMDLQDNSKILFFKTASHEKRFLQTNPFIEDNYLIVHENDSFIYLDDIIMPLQSYKTDSIKYELLTKRKAKKKVNKVLKLHRK